MRRAAILVLVAAAAAVAVPAVAAHRPTAKQMPNDPLWRGEWGPRAVSMPSVWARATHGRRVIVAVVDTGVDASQPDLAGLVLPGWNTVTGTADTNDDNGHGTMVAGVIGARANNRLGGAGYCRTCAILPVKVLDASGQGRGSAIAAGIDWATTHGASVINVSLVLDMQDADVDAAVARAVRAGAIVVAAAGNGGSTTPTYPAADPGVISVGGADPLGSLYSWSNSGDWVSVSGPGCNLATTLGGGFSEFCGTSSAAAAVSGALAQVLAASTVSARALAAIVPHARIDAATLAFRIAQMR